MMRSDYTDNNDNNSSSSYAPFEDDSSYGTASVDTAGNGGTTPPLYRPPGKSEREIATTTSGSEITYARREEIEQTLATLIEALTQQRLFTPPLPTEATSPVTLIWCYDPLYEVVLYFLSPQHLAPGRRVDQLLDPRLEQHLQSFVGKPLCVENDPDGGVVIAVSFGYKLKALVDPVTGYLDQSRLAAVFFTYQELTTVPDPAPGVASNARRPIPTHEEVIPQQAKPDLAPVPAPAPTRPKPQPYAFKQVLQDLAHYKQQLQLKNTGTNRSNTNDTGTSHFFFCVGRTTATATATALSATSPHPAVPPPASMPTFPLITNLAQVIHLLVAGKSGSGKSFFFNQAITSLATLYGPDELKMLLIDMKGGVTFAPYNAMPHLVRPVVSDVPTLLHVLVLLNKEAQRRLDVIRQAGLSQNIVGHNRAIEEALANGQLPAQFQTDPRYEVLPPVLVVFDELNQAIADEQALAIQQHQKRAQQSGGGTARRFVSQIRAMLESLVRQARSVGIYLWLGVQRPDPEVVNPNILQGMNAVLALNVSNRKPLAYLMGTSMAREAVLEPGPGRGYFKLEGEPVRVEIPFLAEPEWNERIKELGAIGLKLPVFNPPTFSAITTSGSGSVGGDVLTNTNVVTNSELATKPGLGQSSSYSAPSLLTDENVTAGANSLSQTVLVSPRSQSAPGETLTPSTATLTWAALIERNLSVTPQAVLWLLAWSLQSNQGRFGLRAVGEAARQFNLAGTARRKPTELNLPPLPGKSKLEALATMLEAAGILIAPPSNSATPRLLASDDPLVIKQKLYSSVGHNLA